MGGFCPGECCTGECCTGECSVGTCPAETDVRIVPGLTEPTAPAHGARRRSDRRRRGSVAASPRAGGVSSPQFKPRAPPLALSENVAAAPDTALFDKDVILGICSSTFENRVRDRIRLSLGSKQQANTT